MEPTARNLKTRSGIIRFPAYVPVTTFGEEYPLDDLVRPYLPRLAPAMMVSYHYAKNRDLNDRPNLPLLVDSGGFSALFKDSQVRKRNGLGCIERMVDGTSQLLTPLDALELQEQIADVAFTLDFPIPPGTKPADAKVRQSLTIANAHWALANRRRSDLRLYACVQAWDAKKARTCAREYAGSPFDGVAIGGLVPRARDLKAVLEIVDAVRGEIGDRPLHVFGLGKPDIVAELFRHGVDSVDSSSYVKLAVDGRLWGRPDIAIADPSPADRLHLALCNLAAACQTALPFSTHRLMYTTQSIEKSLDG
ncbi:tRNA-guanine family transglycosylase [Singulisphaera sp. GP187]|uniref:tRNA-guanine transglycosylase n=1 Tax=Singulisphaera sp. GP187 TaxID=1882752 RepID=UPI00092AC41C|nr:tRNA-guanine transglycosylase [Singulisphaera sp. GP187]SIO63305.1 tRNA-guanine family transglycosylase [Singulisphaera sp. GP187]